MLFCKKSPAFALYEQQQGYPHILLNGEASLVVKETLGEFYLESFR